MRKTSKSRSTVAKAIRKMQIPAYCPVLCGVKAVDQRGVDVDATNVMAIDSLLIVVMSEDDDVAIDMVPVEVAIDIVPIVDAVASIGIDMSMLRRN